MKKNFTKIIISLTVILFIGWGGTSHRIINRNISLSLPAELSFLNWTDSLAAHASDADNRKGTDPNEAPKHFIDIDNYQMFVDSGYIIQDYDSLVAVYGYSFVIDQGTLPWAILATYDSLKANFLRNNFHKAMLYAADLGHYVADAHMPLHITRNYNGQFTGQTGVHSRFESTMINNFSSEIIYTGDSAVYINNIEEFVFSFIYSNYDYVDSVLYVDSVAKAFAGSYNSAYYSKMWELGKKFTIRLHKNSSYILACLIYSAWKDAISSVPVELTSFTAERNKNKIILQWSTATELNNYGFEIQKKSNDVWEYAGFVNGNGTSSENHYYNFMDENKTPSTIFYRLKQIDIDGSVNYSNEIEVNEIPGTFTLEQNYPNPFNPGTTISYTLSRPSEIKISIYNSNGELVQTLFNGYKEEGNHTLDFNAEDITSGIYFYKVEANNTSLTKKMILIK